MKLHLWSPRLILRGVRALESIATSLSELRDVQFKLHGFHGTVRVVDDGTDDDESAISYTDEHAIHEQQQRAKRRAAAGFPISSDDILPQSH